MKVQINEPQKPDFEPISVTFTLESKSELAAFLLLHNDWFELDRVVQEQADGSEEFQVFNPRITHNFFPMEAWSELNARLDKYREST